jgi:hypothetical protein
MPWQLEHPETYDGGAEPGVFAPSHAAVVSGPVPAAPVVADGESPPAPDGWTTAPVPAVPVESPEPALPVVAGGGVMPGLRVVPSEHPTTAAIPHKLAAIVTARTVNFTAFSGTRLELMDPPRSARFGTAGGFANHPL